MISVIKFLNIRKIQTIEKTNSSLKKIKNENMQKQNAIPGFQITQEKFREQ